MCQRSRKGVDLSNTRNIHTPWVKNTLNKYSLRGCSSSSWLCPLVESLLSVTSLFTPAVLQQLFLPEGSLLPAFHLVDCVPTTEPPLETGRPQGMWGKVTKQRSGIKAKKDPLGPAPSHHHLRSLLYVLSAWAGVTQRAPAGNKEKLGCFRDSFSLFRNSKKAIPEM